MADTEKDVPNEDPNKEPKKSKKRKGKSENGLKKKKKKKKKSEKTKKSEKPSLALPSADALLDSGDVPDFLATHQKEEKSIMVEKKIEADLDRKKKLEAEIAMMEDARMREAEKEFEYDVADKEYKAQRARIKSLKPKVAKGPNIMNRMSIIDSTDRRAVVRSRGVYKKFITDTQNQAW
eukprot:CAMPEP_0167787560 /NCGR_PEP_ID=MMETSP0111_2-20121227/9506_1 /TAXON_ID=91324 /ORGANISM="Lotharella globosa, Strain CCCM811" /LENGTH=178 /DNA_ID=CAMNT_0007679247 /DNA_START=1 /DNA_END=535 /DNA_ORIENTATION=+